MTFKRIRAVLIKNKNIGLFDGMSALIPGKNAKGDIIAYWILVGSILIILLVMGFLVVYDILGHFFTKEI